MRHTAILVACAAMLGYVAVRVLAGTGNPCATSITFDDDHEAIVSCPRTPCTAAGRTGTCENNVINANRVVLWKWDSNTNQWIATGVRYTGQVEACHCRVNEGDEENPIWVYYHGPCCDVARVGVLDGSPDHHVALMGECGTDNCSAGSCIATGAYIVVTADCQ